jgi:hypothetical protein
LLSERMSKIRIILIYYSIVFSRMWIYYLDNCIYMPISKLATTPKKLSVNLSGSCSAFLHRSNSFSSNGLPVGKMTLITP